MAAAGGIPASLTQLALALLAFVVPCHTSVEQRTLNGVYTIVHKGSGRRISARPQVGFAVINASEPILHDEMWLFSAQDNNSYAIANVANGVRIVAKSGADWEKGFFAVHGGPIYQDQKWLLFQHSDGCYVIVNWKSGRRMLARSSLDGSSGDSDGMPVIPVAGKDGFSATAHEWPVHDDQLWWLINQERDESAVVAQSLGLERDEKARAADELGAEVSRLRTLLLAEQATATRLLKEAASIEVEVLWWPWSVVALAVTFVLCCWRSRSRLAADARAQRDLASRLDKELRAELGEEGTVPEPSLGGGEPASGSCPDFWCQVFNTEVDQEAIRLIKIQCPGVEHADVSVSLIFNGCDVTIRRQASPGVEALTWRRRFRFRNSEGLFEFKEDQMQLERGFLQLFFRAYTFQTRLIRFPQYFNLEADDDADIEYPDYDDDNTHCFDGRDIACSALDEGVFKGDRRRSWGAADTESTASTSVRRRSWPSGFTETESTAST